MHRVPRLVARTQRSRSLAVLALLAILPILVSASSSPSSPLGWIHTLVDSNPLDVPISSLAISLSGTISVAWEGNSGKSDVWWADRQNGTGVKKEVFSRGIVACYENDLGPVAAYKPTNGAARIASACNAPDYQVYWSTRTGTKWVTSQIDEAPQPYSNMGVHILNLSVCFDPSGNANVFYGDANGVSVRWLSWDGTKWVVAYAIPPTAFGGGFDGPAVSCAFDPSTGQPTIAVNGYSYVPWTLSYMKYDAGTGSWSSEVIAYDAIGVPSLAFDSSGNPWIAFRRGSVSNSWLAVAHKSAGIWTIDTVDTSSAVTGLYPSLAFYQGAQVRVAYYDRSLGDLRYAKLTGSTWTLSTIDSGGDVGLYPTLRYKSDGSREVAYWDKTAAEIWWAH